MTVSATLARSVSRRFTRHIPDRECPAAASIIFDVCRAIRAFCNAKMLPALLCCKDDLNVFQHNTDSFFRPFLAPILCCQHFPSSFQQNRGVWVLASLAGKIAGKARNRPPKRRFAEVVVTGAIGVGTILVLREALESPDRP